jgi:hypothetical protein
MNLIDATRTKNTYTGNGAITNSTSLDPTLDLFFIAGASRNMSEHDIKLMLEKAISFNTILTLKLIFWASDIRGGIGERRFTRIALTFLNDYYPELLSQVVHHVPEYSRWDNMFHLPYKVISPIIRQGLKDKNGLLAKWLPRKSQFSNLASKIRKDFGWTNRQYRKIIVELSNTVEQLMSKNEWDNIEYDKLPSVAGNKYRTAFYKHDEARYTEFINSVLKGENKINSATLFPYQLYQAFIRGDNEKSIEAQWNSLPNYLTDNTKRILPVCDVSGSMTGLPMDISVSLGVYISERNKGIFKDAFITFSSNPRMEHLKGNICQRFRQLSRAHWSMSTDLKAVFILVLKSAVYHKLPESEMPTQILIISDMEFDEATGGNKITNYEKIKKQYNDHGYELPSIVFWNVRGRIDNVPVNKYDENTALISGASPSIIKSVLGETMSPVQVMLDTLNTERYSVFDNIKVI